MEISSAIEFGCGDGAQLALCRYPSYLGFDVSSSAIVECQSRFAGVSCQQFKLLDDYQGERADLTLSLDVIYHLVKQDVYEAHLRLLFDSSDRYVIVFSTDHDTKAIENSRHCRHRCFTDWVQEHRPEFVLTDVQTNKSANPNAAKFYIFEKEC
jgi:hypothetical protein